MSRAGRLSLLSMLLVVTGCATTSSPIQTVDRVNLERFMGDWYVIASIPIFIEADAYNAVESYALNDDGTIATTYRFNEGGFDGEEKVYHATGFVRDNVPGNAVWGMQFIWPFKAEYRIIYLSDSYRQAIIGRSARDYVWIMSRDPQVSTAEYERLVGFVRDQGYEVSELRRVPHGHVGTERRDI